MLSYFYGDLVAKRLTIQLNGDPTVQFVFYTAGIVTAVNF